MDYRADTAGANDWASGSPLVAFASGGWMVVRAAASMAVSMVDGALVRGDPALRNSDIALKDISVGDLERLSAPDPRQLKF